jgi:hypothetical protein
MGEIGVMLEDNEATLTWATQTGDMDAFALLLVRHRPMVAALCRQELGEFLLAEDAVQEAAFLAAGVRARSPPCLEGGNALFAYSIWRIFPTRRLPPSLASRKARIELDYSRRVASLFAMKVFRCVTRSLPRNRQMRLLPSNCTE